MRFRLPGECVGVTYAGVRLERGPDGMIEADAAAVAALAPHGILPAGAVEPPQKTPRDRRAVDDRRMLR